MSVDQSQKLRIIVNQSMHPRNIFKIRPPNYEELVKKYPTLRPKCFIGAGGKICIDFNDPEAVRLIAEILLLEYFELNVKIPAGSLVPRIPQRLNYILLIEDLISLNNLQNDHVIGVDIGVGSTCVYPLLGATVNQWKFVATDISQQAINEARENVKANSLDMSIDVVHNKQPDAIFKEIFTENEYANVNFTFSMCNPPFFDPEEAEKKFISVGGPLLINDNVECGERGPPHSATAAVEGEVFCEGGELSFVKTMIEESQQFPYRVRLYTSMVGKRSSLKKLSALLDQKKIKKMDYTLSQGKTARWVLVWTFYEDIDLGINK